MISYHIRSRDLITVVNEIKSGRLILDAYFQRNLVWRDAHKQDFIKTILLGYPFPQIFVSKGLIDIEQMQTTSCVVDGQQRLDAIVGFIDGVFAVDGRKYHDLSSAEKSEFLKYEIAVIELDLDNNDPSVKEIFQRLNRTANSLTAIEKLASQYAPSLFMLVASHIVGELVFDSDEDTKFRVDPKVDPGFFAWAEKNPSSNFPDLVNDGSIFRSHEVSRKVHLMHVLNIMAALNSGFTNRNDSAKVMLETYAEEFLGMEEMVSMLDSAAASYKSMNLPNDSYWRNKANFFSLIVAISNVSRGGKAINSQLLAIKLGEFEKSLPVAYRLAAREAVNNASERQTRNDYIDPIVQSALGLDSQ